MKDFGRVDGMDFFAVYEVAQQAVEYARTTGPVLIEAITYRYEGHGVSDRIYMKRVEEMQTFQQRDPLIVMQTKLREMFPDIEPELAKVEPSVAAIVEEAVRFAEESPAPTAEDLTRNIYA
jgi:pyruvate dehydrogenase E1 component alpha subunit